MKMKMFSKACSFTAKAASIGVVAVTFHDLVGSVSVVEGSSMDPTLKGSETKDIVLIDRYRVKAAKKVERGDVVMFTSPFNPKEYHVKRIIGLPGDLIYSKPEYISPDVLKDQRPRYKNATLVPRGKCWVEGDNPATSVDSNDYGPIPLALITGRVAVICYPFTRFGKVSHDEYFQPPAANEKGQGKNPHQRVR